MLLKCALPGRRATDAVDPKHFSFLGSIARASSTRPLLYRTLTQSPRLPSAPSSKSRPSKPPADQPLPENPQLPSFNLWKQIRQSKRSVRYTVYFGLGLMATVESTFWFNVIRAKFFGGEEDRKRADEIMDRVREAMRGYRHVWMRNYGRFYGAYLWGAGYGGLDGLDDVE